MWQCVQARQIIQKTTQVTSSCFYCIMLFPLIFLQSLQKGVVYQKMQKWGYLCRVCITCFACTLLSQFLSSVATALPSLVINSFIFFSRMSFNACVHLHVQMQLYHAFGIVNTLTSRLIGSVFAQQVLGKQTITLVQIIVCIPDIPYRHWKNPLYLQRRTG